MSINNHNYFFPFKPSRESVSSYFASCELHRSLQYTSFVYLSYLPLFPNLPFPYPSQLPSFCLLADCCAKTLCSLSFFLFLSVGYGTHSLVHTSPYMPSYIYACNWCKTTIIAHFFFPAPPRPLLLHSSDTFSRNILRAIFFLTFPALQTALCLHPSDLHKFVCIFAVVEILAGL